MAYEATTPCIAMRAPLVAPAWAGSEAVTVAQADAVHALVVARRSRI